MSRTPAGRKLRFLQQDLDDIIQDNAHHRCIIKETKQLLDEAQVSYQQVVIAGGYAANVAGITKSANDIDLFCLHQKNQSVFESLNSFITTKRYPTGKPSVYDGETVRLPFEYNYLKFDLVRSKFVNAEYVLSHFDLNWSMAFINLGANQIVTAEQAWKPYPIIFNKTPKTLARLLKYRERLVIHLNEKKYNKVKSRLSDK